MQTDEGVEILVVDRIRHRYNCSTVEVPIPSWNWCIDRYQAPIFKSSVATWEPDPDPPLRQQVPPPMPRLVTVVENVLSFVGLGSLCLGLLGGLFLFAGVERFLPFRFGPFLAETDLPGRENSKLSGWPVKTARGQQWRHKVIAHALARVRQQVPHMSRMAAKGCRDTPMPPRSRGRVRGQISEESDGQNEGVQHSIPFRRRASQVEVEVDEMAARVDDMELVMARFQRMNPQMFNVDEPSSDVESWLQHITGLFDRGRPQVVQGNHLMVPGVQHSQSSQSSQPPQQQTAQQSGRHRFRPRGHQFKKKSGSSSSGSGSSSSSSPRAGFVANV
ncbi:hypothetical protein F511_26111 [Dorcoceras hygrometricum]|uniref:Uncharacterized protein n=1 Tax=Dorcoceras hygrometricum TaxID=472368 RepID=A0A2Z7D431_9LAMI|nr:hypothetical protein F511_26111 [Dorcoceras hygrometricum]